jgi:hypothetical protein
LFSNGIEKIVDFTSFLKDAKNVFIPLREIEYFKQFQLDDITISWPNGADFEPELLYEMGKEIKITSRKTPYKKRPRIVSNKPLRPRITSKSHHS